MREGSPESKKRLIPDELTVVPLVLEFKPEAATVMVRYPLVFRVMERVFDPFERVEVSGRMA